jgi:hypothetical protein
MRTVRSNDRSKVVLRTLLLWALVLLLVEVALALLDAPMGVRLLVGSAVVALGVYDVLRDVTTPLVAAVAACAVVVIGVFMALDEAHIAPRIVNTLFLGMVLTAAGIAVVAVGGGGIQPMRERWTSALEGWQARSSASRLQRDRRLQQEQLQERERHIDLRDPTAPVPGADRVAAADDTTLVPTQERIRAEIRSDTHTLP